jgi:hypothetical protein
VSTPKFKELAHKWQTGKISDSWLEAVEKLMRSFYSRGYRAGVRASRGVSDDLRNYDDRNADQQIASLGRRR